MNRRGRDQGSVTNMPQYNFLEFIPFYLIMNYFDRLCLKKMFKKISIYFTEYLQKNEIPKSTY